MSLQSSIALPSVDNTFGACYIGSVIATILYGILNLQVLIYYKRHPNDWWVYWYSRYFGLFIHIYPVAQFTDRYIGRVLDTFHIAFSTHALYFYLITMFGKFLGALESDLWSMKLQLSLSNFIVVYIQWYESYNHSEDLNWRQLTLTIRIYAIRLWKRDPQMGHMKFALHQISYPFPLSK
ncbi:uncharacterized protein ARMOST_20461 [Armillaria ostoyae]|uniref:Uncharacterized protein n=1 Tax=Armillaria ostoyae TaxID=47428 RepID=A0A284S7F0_ARMOS|nr:uncharacterized protein ARMOST_20461 [Armillaria ostoyae]